MTAQPLRIDERNHVEKPLLDQLTGLGWEILDLDNQQRPADQPSREFYRGGDAAGAARTPPGYQSLVGGRSG